MSNQQKIISIQPLYRFKNTYKQSPNYRLEDFNTTLVSVQVYPPKQSQSRKRFQYNPCIGSRRTLSDWKEEGEISIQPLYRFKQTATKVFKKLRKFQYNPCIGSRKPTQKTAQTHPHFNTTLVSVQEKGIPQKGRFSLISIQPLYRFKKSRRFSKTSKKAISIQPLYRFKSALQISYRL